MSNHPNRGWRGRWSVSGQEARHGPSGLVVRFARRDDGWDGQAVNGEEIARALGEVHGIPEAAKMLARLMREAGEAWNERPDA